MKDLLAKVKDAEPVLIFGGAMVTVVICTICLSAVKIVEAIWK